MVKRDGRPRLRMLSHEDTKGVETARDSLLSSVSWPSCLRGWAYVDLCLASIDTRTRLSMIAP